MGNLLRREFFLVWVILAFLLVFIFLLGPAPDKQTRTHSHNLNPESKFLIPDKIHGMGAIEIIIDGNLYRYQRDNKMDWFYHDQNHMESDNHNHGTNKKQSDKIKYSLAGFGRTQKERSFTFDFRNDEYGVMKPKLYILIYENPDDTKPSIKISVGDIAPDNLSRYVLVNSQIYTIANFHIDNLLNLIDETVS